MGPAGWSRSDPWFPVFVMATLSFAGSLFALAAVVALEDDRGEPQSPSPRGKGENSAPLTYTGVLPAGVTLDGMKLEEGSLRTDVVVEAAGVGEGVPVRFFVPVASPSAGVDSLTGAQLQALLAGETTWADVGGIGGKPQFAVVLPDLDAVQRFGGTHTVRYGDYASLLDAMAGPGAAMIAFVPLDFVSPRVSAIAVDGVDIVRGRGDRSAWPFAERIRITGLSERGKAAAPFLADQLRATLPKATTIVATGDILQSRCSLVRIRETGDWAAALRGPVAEYLAAADLALGSLDGSIQDIGAPRGCVETTNLTSPPEVIAALTLAGLDEVTVATNHIFDCGQVFCEDRAFLRTLELLAQAGIKTVGGGKNLQEALAPAIFEVNGTTFGILGFDDIAAQDLEATDTAPGTAPLDDDYSEERKADEPAFFRPAEELSLNRFTETIRDLKQQVDVVIIQVQTGTEDTHDPSPRSLKALRAAADAGATLVVGNQAHYVQAVESLGDAFIAYALGNFVFDQRHTPEHTQGYLLEATFWGKQLANVRLIPYQIENQYRPVFASGALRAKILADVFAASGGLPPPP